MRGKIPILAQSYGFFVAYSSPPFVMIVRGECRANEPLDFTCFFSTKIGDLSLSVGAIKGGLFEAEVLRGEGEMESFSRAAFGILL